MSDFRRKKYDADMPADHKTQESRDLQPGDLRLRDRGFKIHSRPSAGPITWIRGGEVFVQEEALRIAEREHKQALSELQKK